MKQEGIPLTNDIQWSYWKLLQQVKIYHNHFQIAETFMTKLSKRLKRSGNTVLLHQGLPLVVTPRLAALRWKTKREREKERTERSRPTPSYRHSFSELFVPPSQAKLEARRLFPQGRTKFTCWKGHGGRCKRLKHTLKNLDCWSSVVIHWAVKDHHRYK